MKKTSTRILTLLCIAALLFAVACRGEENTTSANGSCTVVIGAEKEAVYTVDLSAVTIDDGLMSILRYLKENQGLTYTEESGSYGAYLTSVGNLRQDMTAGVYIGIWTSSDEDADVSAYATTKEYNGMTLNSSGVSASEMHITDGTVIYIGVLSY